MNDRERVIDKVRKLLALSNSPNENEAIAAAEKAQAMILEHNLTNADIEATGDRLFAAQCQSDSLPWRRPIAMHLAKMYLCLYFVTFHKEDRPGSKIDGYKRWDIHNFFGPEQSVVVTKLMFKYLCEAVSRLAREGSQSVPEGERGSYQTSFKAACSVRICLRLRERMKLAERGQVKAVSGRNLPALMNLQDETQSRLKSMLEKVAGAKMGTLPAKVSTNHGKGMIDGFDAGGTIGLDAQVEKNKSSMIKGR